VCPRIGDEQWASVYLGAMSPAPHDLGRAHALNRGLEIDSEEVVVADQL
jgi:hypothetical protein